MLGEQAVGTTEGVASSAYPLTIGACPDTGRKSEADFYTVRVYSKALTEAELRAQATSSPAYAQDDKAVQLWLDFDNIAKGSVPGDVDANGVFDTRDVVLLQKWLHAVPNTVLADAAAGELMGDSVLDTFDLAMMKRMLLS